MKDIVRQAVADAAEWMYCERGVNQANLINADELSIVETAGEIRLREQADKRKEQLADFVAKPRIDNVLITGPGGFVAHGAGVVGRTVMIDPRPMVTVRDDKGEFSQQTATDWQKQCIDRGKRRTEVADHALAIWLRYGCGAWLLRNAGPDEILKLSLEGSGRDFNKDVELPAPSDPKWSIAVTASFDGAEGEGRVWLSAKDDDESMIAIEGRQNAAMLASMLIDWAQPDVVVVPRALLERLEDISRTSYALDTEYLEAIKALTDFL